MHILVLNQTHLELFGSQVGRFRKSAIVAVHVQKSRVNKAVHYLMVRHVKMSFQNQKDRALWVDTLVLAFDNQRSSIAWSMTLVPQEMRANLSFDQLTSEIRVVKLTNPIELFLRIWKIPVDLLLPATFSLFGGQNHHSAVPFARLTEFVMEPSPCRI